MAGEIKAAFDAAFRDYVTDGVPASGRNPPKKSEIRQAAGIVQDTIDTEVAARIADKAELSAQIFSNASPPLAEVAAAQTVALPSNAYANGTAGVGATITATANGALAGSYFDGATLAAGKRLFVGLEGAKNGIYVLTQLGDATHPWILTRATDADSADKLGLCNFAVIGGTTLYGRSFKCQQKPADITVGTTALTFAIIKDDSAFSGEVVNARGSYPTLGDRSDALIGTRSVAPVDVTGSGTAIANTAVYFWPSTQKAFDQWITSFKAGMGTDGTLKIVVAKVENDGSLTFVSSQNVAMLAGTGAVSIDPPLLVPAGSVVGVQQVAGTWYYTTGTIPNGESRWHTAALPTTSTPKTVTTTNGLQWGVTLTGEIASKARSAFASTSGLWGAIGSSQAVGWSNLVNTGTDTPANYSTVQQVPAPVDSYIAGVRVGAGATGTATISAVKMNPDNTVADIKNATTVTLINGVVNLATAIPLPAGYRPAITGGAYKYQANNNPTGLRVHLKSGVMAIGDTLTDSASHRFEVAFTIENGLTFDAHRAAALASQAGGNTGLGLLSAADNTGVADATVIFAAAAAAHPFPYVPPGTFSVTAIPNNGKGFWGPGKVLVNGVLMSLPERPEFGSRFLKVRAAFMPQIATGSCVIVNGDSISNGAYATNPRTNHVGLLTRFANLGIALDEAVLVNFDNADTSGGNAFHGISFASPSTPTYGTGGPVGKSLMLQPGQVLTLAAATYEKVDVTYQGVSGGQLAFAYNGTTYATVNTATTGNDVLAAPGPTGQTGSGTYTITNSGSVAIEITSLVRLGVKSGSLPRLVVCRMAHGSYTMASYTASRMQSMLRIATAVGGGSNHLVIPALGTNDAVGANLDYGQMRQATLDYVGRWVTAGVPAVNILPIMPWRWSSYGTSNYPNELGGIRQGYRELGVRRVIQTDAYDFISEGMAGDGHPNDAGFIAEFNAIVATLCDGAV